jgi:hypothetical protein
MRQTMVFHHALFCISRAVQRALAARVGTDLVIGCPTLSSGNCPLRAAEG